MVCKLYEYRVRSSSIVSFFLFLREMGLAMKCDGTSSIWNGKRNSYSYLNERKEKPVMNSMNDNYYYWCYEYWCYEYWCYEFATNTTAVSIMMYYMVYVVCSVT